MTQSVEEFYYGRSIFITGATGFLGKVLIEKILHDCSGITKIYILLRTKIGSAAKTRLTQLLESKAFDRIRRKDIKLFDKIQVIKGDVTFDNLGISASDIDLLARNVSVVIHSAATIRFDEPLKRAVRINVAATKKVMEMCLKFDKLKAFIHVSTAYCNEVKTDIVEKVYEEKLDPEKIIELSDTLTDEMLDALAPKLYGNRPSSYHYTKALAENVAQHFSDKIPIGIVRPSIITASLTDPMPGWIDNYNGPSGYLVTAGKGILRTMLVEGEKICDAIPVDIVSNTIINLAWYIGAKQNKDSSKEPMVVNCTTGQINPITWNEIRDLSHPWLIKYPTHEMFRYPGPIFVSNKNLHKLIILIEHDLPTFFIDLLFKSLGHSPMLGPIYQKVNRTSEALEHFTLNEWIYRNEKFRLLNNALSMEDSEKFNIDVVKIDWSKYMESYVIGIRHYLLNEDPKTIASAKFRLDLLFYGTQLTKVTTASVSMFCLYQLYKLATSTKRK